MARKGIRKNEEWWELWWLKQIKPVHLQVRGCSWTDSFQPRCKQSAFPVLGLCHFVTVFAVDLWLWLTTGIQSFIHQGLDVKWATVKENEIHLDCLNDLSSSEDGMMSTWRRKHNNHHFSYVCLFLRSFTTIGIYATIVF